MITVTRLIYFMSSHIIGTVTISTSLAMAAGIPGAVTAIPGAVTTPEETPVGQTVIICSYRDFPPIV